MQISVARFIWGVLSHHNSIMSIRKERQKKYKFIGSSRNEKSTNMKMVWKQHLGANLMWLWRKKKKVCWDIFLPVLTLICKCNQNEIFGLKHFFVVWFIPSPSEVLSNVPLIRGLPSSATSVCQTAAGPFPQAAITDTERYERRQFILLSFVLVAALPRCQNLISWWKATKS